jgi:hypothetical protein
LGPAQEAGARWPQFSVNQQAALLSFTYNCGPAWFGAEGFARLTTRLCHGELDKVPAALMLYVNPGGPSEIAADIPVPCGYLHRSPVEQPGGGGHWLIVVGHTPTHLIVHDPFGEADLASGATIGRTARCCHYSRRNYSCADLRLRAALDAGR